MVGTMRTKNVQSSEKRSAKQKTKRYATYSPKTAVFSVLQIIHEVLSSRQNGTGCGANDLPSSSIRQPCRKKKKRVSLRSEEASCRERVWISVAGVSLAEQE